MYPNEKESFFEVYPSPMKLMMYIGNDLIEAVQLDDDKIRVPGYIGHFKRNLKMKYRELISQYPIAPDFLVTNILPHSVRENNPLKGN